MLGTIEVVDAAPRVEGLSFEAMYDRHGQDVLRYCLAYLRSLEDTEDVVAEVFERAYRAWVGGHGPSGPPLPWLFLIARRIMIDRSRRGRLLGWLPFGRLPAALEPVAESSTDQPEFWIWFEQLATVLTTRQRDVLVLRYQFDVPDVEIGRILGLSPAGVRSLARRALETLREHPELLR